jgi:hypothetical protein
VRKQLRPKAQPGRPDGFSRANTRWILALVVVFAPCICFAQGRTPAGQPTAAPVEPKELSDFLSIVLGADGAVGVDANNPRRHTFFGGIKLGLPFTVKGKPPDDVLRTVTLDLGYDRMQSRGGFSGELSMMLPMGRFPRPHTEGANYIRIYVEPGAGYRAGGGDFGAYASAKAMLVLFSEKRLTGLNSPPCPFVEIQHRFPVTSPRRGDTRIVIGFIAASCNHCGE